MTGPTSSAETLSGRIHGQLRGDILTGRYAAGEPLPSERRLSEELGASRHAVREALKRLQEAGLIAIAQGGSTRVRDWRRHGGLDLLLDGDVPAELRAGRATMEMRACIGADAARRCAERATPAQRAELRSRVEQLAAVDAPDARNAHYEVLWDLIVDGADNVAYRLALTTLVAHQRVASVAPDAVARELDDVPAIRALVEAVATADGDAAHARAREILERSIPGD